MLPPRHVALLALVGALSACGGPNPPTHTADQAPPPTRSETAVTKAEPAPDAAPQDRDDPSQIVLPAHGLKLALPPGWSQQRDGNVVIALSPSKKSGMFVYGAKLSGSEEVIRVLHLFDDTFGVTIEVELGEKWLAKSGLRYSRNEKALTTKRGERASTITLLGAAPADRESSAGVLAIAVEGDGDAKAAIEAALETLAPI